MVLRPRMVGHTVQGMSYGHQTEGNQFSLQGMSYGHQTEGNQFSYCAVSTWIFNRRRYCYRRSAVHRRSGIKLWVYEPADPSKTPEYWCSQADVNIHEWFRSIYDNKERNNIEPINYWIQQQQARSHRSQTMWMLVIPQKMRYTLYGITANNFDVQEMFNLHFKILLATWIWLMHSFNAVIKSLQFCLHMEYQKRSLPQTQNLFLVISFSHWMWCSSCLHR